MAEIKEDIIDEVGSECDREVSKIDFSGVTMRSKKMRAVEENMPRPMSWEGELSDSEMKQVTETLFDYITMIRSSASIWVEGRGCRYSNFFK